MIDINTENLIDLREARRHPVMLNRKTGKPRSLASVYRDVLRGSRGPDGERIKLEVVRTPSGLVTSNEAIVRFIARLSGLDAPSGSPSPSKMRKTQIEAAEQELLAAGF
jgi:hypothetical protein